MENVIEYLEQSRDKRLKVWYFSSEYPSESIRSTMTFGDDRFGIHIIDQFAGRKPILINYESLYKSLQMTFVPTMILDSHIVSYLMNYINSPSRLREYQVKAIHKFLSYLIFTHYDYNPFFYYLESAAKSDEGIITDYTIRASVEILKLQTMRPEPFLEERRIITDPDLLEIERQRYGGNTLEDIAKGKVEAMLANNEVGQVNSSCDLIYAALLKIALIHKTSKKGVLNKMLELLEFMHSTLGISLGREKMVALYYFAGRLDGFIPFQKGCKYRKLLKRMRATAWDVLLLRLPELLLWPSDEKDAIVGYVCTSEKAIYKIGRLFTIETIGNMPPNYEFSIPTIAFNAADLQKDLGEELVRMLSELGEIENKRFQDRAENKVMPQIMPQQLTVTIKMLEDELRGFC